MPRLLKFPSIEQFRNVYKHIRQSTQFQGLDEDGKAIYDESVEYPKIKFLGTQKLDGTNAAFVYDYSTEEYWCQSRERVIDVISDNYGFANFAEGIKGYLLTIIDKVRFSLPENKYTIGLYGEFAGQGIANRVAVSKLPKSFYIFAIRVDTEESTIWFHDYDLDRFIDSSLEEHKIFSISRFPIYEVEIDFNNPTPAVEQMESLVTQIENNCPVGKYFGIENGKSEGLVWTTHERKEYLLFKTKNESHKISKTKVLIPVDVEKVESIAECVDKIVTEQRLQQGLETMISNGIEIEIENIGTFLKWVSSDCAKEEMDTIVQSGLQFKEVSKEINTKAKTWFMSKIRL